MASALPAVESVEGWRRVQKSITFDGGTTNAIGDFDGTGDPFTIFTVTGAIKLRLVALCTTLLASTTGTLEVGTALGTASIIAQTTATNIDAGEIWHDATPDNSVEAITVAPELIVTQNIIGTTATANITAGVIEFIALWTPLSKDGNLE